MEKLRNILPDWLNKYKYAILIIVIGIVLMMLPGKKAEDNTLSGAETKSPEIKSMESRIEDILKTVRGAGEVNVLLTVAEGEEILYQEDIDDQISDNNESYRANTVMALDSQRNETGLIKQTIPPKYLGAVIVCQGADDPTVRLAIVDAVSKATGLRADKISVLKMK